MQTDTQRTPGPGPRPRRAFTLIELLVVISILGLLVSILVPTVGLAKRAARVAETQALIHSLQTGLESFKSDGLNSRFLSGDYPESEFVIAMNGPYEGSTPYTMYGAQSLVLALVGPDLQGTAGFGLSYGAGPPAWTENRYADDSGYPRFGPYVDVTGLEIEDPTEDDSKCEMRHVLGAEAEHAPVFLDPFGMPILYYKADTSGDTIEEIYQLHQNQPYIAAPELEEYSAFAGMEDDDELWTDFVEDDREFAEDHPYRADSFILLSAGPDKWFGPKPGQDENLGTDDDEPADDVANFPVN